MNKKNICLIWICYFPSRLIVRLPAAIAANQRPHSARGETLAQLGNDDDGGGQAFGSGSCLMDHDCERLRHADNAPFPLMNRFSSSSNATNSAFITSNPGVQNADDGARM